MYKLNKINFILLLITTVEVLSLTPVQILQRNSVAQDWIPIIEDQLSPWDNGISLSLIDKTFNHYGSHIIFQYINGRLYINDPKGYCLCNRTPVINLTFEFHYNRCVAMQSILEETIKHNINILDPLPDFEFVWSLDDFPYWNTHKMYTNDIQYKGKNFYPGFGAIRCWSKGTLTLPFYGSHGQWHINTFESTLIKKQKEYILFNEKNGNAIFRGGVDRGCSFERDTIIDYEPNKFPTHTNSNCGRYLLLNFSKKYPLLIDYHGPNDTYMSIEEQGRLYKYVLSVEGWGSWADRLSLLISQENMVVIDQEHLCDQWFEPLLKPFVHYIPTAHDFRNLPARIIWANNHKNTVKQILNEAKRFTNKYLLKEGILTYVRTYLSLYIKKINYNVSIRKDSTDIKILNNKEQLKTFCIKKV